MKPFKAPDPVALALDLMAHARTHRRDAAKHGVSPASQARCISLAQAFERAAAKAMQGVFPFDNDNEVKP